MIAAALDFDCGKVEKGMCRHVYELVLQVAGNAQVHFAVQSADQDRVIRPVFGLISYASKF